MGRPYHVQVENGNPEAKVILIEHSFKLVVDKGSAFCETWTSPGVK